MVSPQEVQVIPGMSGLVDGQSRIRQVHGGVSPDPFGGKRDAVACGTLAYHAPLAVAIYNTTTIFL